MAAIPHWTQSLAAVSLLLTASSAVGQGPPQLITAPTTAPASLRAPGVRSLVPTGAAPGQIGQPNYAVAPIRSLPPVKPFQMMTERPTVSPYLQLHREDLDDSLPNYYAFVLPQIQQQEVLRRQQLELKTIQKRLQQTANQTAVDGNSPGAGGQPATYHARFLNTGSYFRGVALPQPQTGQNP